MELKNVRLRCAPRVISESGWPLCRPSSSSTVRVSGGVPAAGRRRSNLTQAGSAEREREKRRGRGLREGPKRKHEAMRGAESKGNMLGNTVPACIPGQISPSPSVWGPTSTPPCTCIQIKKKLSQERHNTSKTQPPH